MDRRYFLTLMSGSIICPAFPVLGATLEDLNIVSPARTMVSSLGKQAATVKVLGIGGAGASIVEYLIRSKTPGINEYICIDSDANSLQRSSAHVKILLGRRGANDHYTIEVETVRAMTWNARELIAEALQNTHAVFIVAGLGGKTGTGATEIVAKIAQDAKALTVALVSTPFGFEGRRIHIANEVLPKIQPYVDCMAPLSLGRYQSSFDDDTSFMNIFKALHATIEVGIQALSSIAASSGLTVSDFTDFRQVLEGSGVFRFGWSSAKANEPAVREALNHPFYLDKLSAHKSTLISIIASPTSIKIADFSEIWANVSLHLPNAPWITGNVVQDHRLNPGEVKVVLLSGGFFKPATAGLTS